MAEEVSYIIRAKDAYSAIHKGADQAVDKTAKNLVKATGVMAVAVGAVSASLVAMAASTANSGDEFQKMAARLGISAQALSEMKHAAELSGASIGDIELGIKKMSKTALDADRGLISASRSFDDLGVSVKDSSGNLKGAEQLFTEVTEGLNNVENETKRAALAQELFGRSGLNLLPLIKSGSEGLKEMRQEAQNLGITFSDFEANQSAAFVDASLRIKSAALGIKNTLGKDLIPFFTVGMDTIADSFMDLKKSGDLDKWSAEVASGVITSFGAVAEVATNLPLIWQASMVSIKTVSADAIAILDTVLLGVEKFYNVLGALPGDIGTPYRQAAGDINAMRDSLSDIGTDLLVSADANEKAGEEWGEWQAKAISAIDSVRNKAQEDVIASAIASPAETETRAAAVAAAPIAVNEDVYGPDLANYQEYLQGKVTAHEQAQEQIRASEQGTYVSSTLAIQNNVAEVEQHHQNKIQLAQISGATQTEIIFMQANAEIAIEKAKSDAKINMARSHASAASGFANNLFIASGKKNKQMFEAHKAFATGEAIISTYQGATKAFAQYGWPYGAIAAGLVIAGGLAQVRQIQSQTMGGGAPSAGGGGGGGSIPTTLSTDAGAGSLIGVRGDEARQTQQITVNVHNPLGSEDWDRIAEEEIMPAINRAGDRDVQLQVNAVEAV